MKKKFLFNELLYGAIINLLFGILFVFIPAGDMVAFLFVILGIIIVLINIPVLLLGLSAFQTSSLAKERCLTSGIAVVLGLTMIFWKNEVFAIVCAVILVILPLIRILSAPIKKIQIKTELPKLILGAFLLILGPWGLTNLLFDIIGYILMAFALTLFIFWIVLNATNNHKQSKNNKIIDAEVIEK